MDFRVIFSDNGTLIDFTNELANYYASEKTFDVTAAQDKFYIGSYFPFNSFYLKMGTVVNAAASVMTVKYWDGEQFRTVAELNDQTKNTSNITLAQSGQVFFTPHKKYAWISEDTTNINDEEQITGLGDVKIYERYWLEITFSGNLTATTKLAWMGSLFSNDDDLGSEYPNMLLSNVLAGFESGKTTWEEQHVISAAYVIKELKKRNVILDEGQILNTKDFTLAACHKVASIYYKRGGPGREDEAKMAERDFSNAMDGTAVIDLNENARSDDYERRTKSNHGFR